MPNRILKDSICTSPNIDALSREAEVFFYRLLVQCDDYGRMDARPAILRAKCYPLQVDSVTQDNIRRWFDELVQAELVIPYHADGGDYLQMRTWERHQQIRAKRSKYPDMQASDINCNQMITDAPVFENPIQSEHVNAGGLNGFTDRRSVYAYHVNEKKKAGVDAPTFTAMVDKLIDAAGWRALVDAAQDDRKLTQAKDQALALVRMGITLPGQVDTLLDGYREANDWRKTPPTPQAIAEYASQVNGRVKAKTTKTAWVLDSNGNRIEKVQVTA